jgi:putative FmdB family regulatory protein
VPIYEYKCAACEHRFEELIRAERDVKNVACPKCGARKVEQQPSVFAAHNAPTKSSRPPGCGGCAAAGGAGCPMGGR